MVVSFTNGISSYEVIITANNITVSNNAAFSGNLAINSTAISIGTASINTQINSTFFTGIANQALTANNSSYLGGVAAASYVNTSGVYTLSGNITFTGNTTIGGGNTYITSNIYFNSANEWFGGGNLTSVSNVNLTCANIFLNAANTAFVGTNTNFQTNVSFSGSHITIGSASINSTVYTGRANAALTIVSVTSASSPYTITSQDLQYFRCAANTSANTKLWLPPMTGTGYKYLFKRVDSNTFNIIISANGSDIIDGLSTYELVSQYAAVEIIDAGSGIADIRSVYIP